MNNLEKQIQSLGTYEIEQHKMLSDIGSDSFVLTHKKSGARIALLPNEDNNKVFYIAFRTPPRDSTGVAHIIEHTVLCGSRDFPVKDPFIEVVKGSLNTFLNAMTYPDKTVYPVASTNEKDFDNLMHVYLDAVFHPNIYTQENIFRQEGWHYEVSEDKTSPVITVNGVVYNEMKGVMSSPDDVLNDLVLSSLYPDTTYAIVSGGDPEVIPTLTYEQYLAFHRHYYHPSNSYIYLYGNMDVIERLRFLDEKYLSGYTKEETHSEIQVQSPFDGLKECSKSYSIQKDEDPSGKAYLSFNAALPIHGNDKDTLAFRVLDYVLCDAEGAPVKEALRKAGIGMSVESLYEPGIYEPYYSIAAKYTQLDRKDDFLQIIQNVLQDQVKNGISQRALQAGINYYEFQYREADFGSYPKGLIYGLDLCDTWLYDDKRVFTNLEVGKYYDELKKDAKDGYFEEMITKYLLNNPHESLAVLVPEKGLTQKQEEEQKAKMAAFASSLSQEELQTIRDEEASLRTWQQTPDSEEDKAKIPMLKREDLSRTGQMPVNEALNETVVGHPVFTGGIDYVELNFDVTDFSEKQFQMLSVYKVLLGALSTKNYSYRELDNEINIWSGGISPGVISSYNAKNPSQYSIFFSMSIKTLEENLSSSLDLAEEILMRTRFDDRERVLEVLQEELSSMKEELQASGHATAVMRASSYLSPQGRIEDDIAGIGAYDTLKMLCDEFDTMWPMLQKDMEALTDAILSPDRLSIEITARKEEMEKALPRLMLVKTKVKEADGQNIKRNEKASQETKKEEKTGSEPIVERGPLNEAFKTAGQVQYVCRAGNYLNKGYSYTGALCVLKVIMGYDYLWNRIRVKGGAYGCMSNFGQDGFAYFVTYRDPHLQASIDTFEEAAEYISNFEADEKTMTKYVIGAVSTMDRPMTPSMLGRYSRNCRLMHLTNDDLQKTRDQVLNCSKEDIQALGQYIHAFLQDQCLCVIGSEAKIEERKDLFGSIRTW